MIPAALRGRLTGWSRSAIVLRIVMLVAPPAAVLMASVAGTPPPPAVLAVVVLASAGFARAPESGFGLLALGAAALWWVRVADDGLHAAVLAAAVLLLAAHVAGLLAALGAPGAAVDADLVSLWIVRGTIVVLAAPLVWLLARLAGDLAPDAALWQAGLLVSVVAVTVSAVVLGAGGRTAR